MKKDHLAESTIKVTGRRLRLIAKAVNLDEPKKIDEYLANKKGKKWIYRKSSISIQKIHTIQ